MTTGIGGMLMFFLMFCLLGLLLLLNDRFQRFGGCQGVSLFGGRLDGF